MEQSRIRMKCKLKSCNYWTWNYWSDHSMWEVQRKWISVLDLTSIIWCKHTKGPLVYVLQEWIEKNVNLIIHFTITVRFLSLYIYKWRMREYRFYSQNSPFHFTRTVSNWHICRVWLTFKKSLFRKLLQLAYSSHSDSAIGPAKSCFAFVPETLGWALACWPMVVLSSPAAQWTSIINILSYLAWPKEIPVPSD